MSGKERKSKASPSQALQLPPIGQTGLILLQPGQELPKEITASEALELIRKAKKAGKPVWVIIG